MPKEFEDEYDILLAGLWDDLDLAEDAMYARFRAERSAFRRWNEKYPIFVIAEFFHELRDRFSLDLRELIDAYYAFWVRGTQKPSLRRINAKRSMLHGQWLKRHKLVTQSLVQEAEIEKVIDPLVAMQFVTGPESWRTQQDGVFFYICFDLRKYGIESSVLRLAMHKATRVRNS